MGDLKLIVPRRREEVFPEEPVLQAGAEVPEPGRHEEAAGLRAGELQEGGDELR